MENYDRKVKALGLLVIKKGKEFQQNEAWNTDCCYTAVLTAICWFSHTPSPKHIKSSLVVEHTRVLKFLPAFEILLSLSHSNCSLSNCSCRSLSCLSRSSRSSLSRSCLSFSCLSLSRRSCRSLSCRSLSSCSCSRRSLSSLSLSSLSLSSLSRSIRSRSSLSRSSSFCLCCSCNCLQLGEKERDWAAKQKSKISSNC